MRIGSTRYEGLHPVYDLCLYIYREPPYLGTFLKIIDWKILVMDFGEIVEVFLFLTFNWLANISLSTYDISSPMTQFDFAPALMKRPNGHFRSMVEAMGEASAAKLMEKLKQ